MYSRCIVNQGRRNLSLLSLDSSIKIDYSAIEKFDVCPSFDDVVVNTLAS
jgi:hypothetical protein